MNITRYLIAALLAHSGAFANQIAKTKVATPESLPAILATAHPGTTIYLQPGTYNNISIVRRSFEPLLNIIGTPGAIVSGINISESTGIHLDNMLVMSKSRAHAVDIFKSDNIILSNSDISGGDRGIVVGLSTSITISSNNIHDIVSDGIDFSGNFLNINSNYISRLHPTPISHPDCIQGMSSLNRTSNITIISNRCFADAQGIFLRSSSGSIFTNIIIKNNILEIGAPNGIFVNPGQNVIIVNNNVRNYGKRWPNGKLVKSRIFIKGDNLMACGNKVADFPLDQSTRSCHSTK